MAEWGFADHFGQGVLKMVQSYSKCLHPPSSKMTPIHPSIYKIYPCSCIFHFPGSSAETLRSNLCNDVFKVKSARYLFLL